MGPIRGNLEEISLNGQGFELVQKDSEDENTNFHPALKNAVISEGQEALWIDDEMSTVTSYIKKKYSAESSVAKKKKFNLFRGGKQGSKQKKSKKSKKAVVLLPQIEENGEKSKTLVDTNIKTKESKKTGENDDQTLMQKPSDVSSLGLKSDSFEYATKELENDDMKNPVNSKTGEIVTFLPQMKNSEKEEQKELEDIQEEQDPEGSENSNTRKKKEKWGLLKVLKGGKSKHTAEENTELQTTNDSTEDAVLPENDHLSPFSPRSIGANPGELDRYGVPLDEEKEEVGEDEDKEIKECDEEGSMEDDDIALPSTDVENETDDENEENITIKPSSSATSDVFLNEISEEAPNAESQPSDNTKLVSDEETDKVDVTDDEEDENDRYRIALSKKKAKIDTEKEAINNEEVIDIENKIRVVESKKEREEEETEANPYCDGRNIEDSSYVIDGDATEEKDMSEQQSQDSIGSAKSEAASTKDCKNDKNANELAPAIEHGPEPEVISDNEEENDIVNEKEDTTATKTKPAHSGKIAKKFAGIFSGNRKNKVKKTAKAKKREFTLKKTEEKANTEAALSTTETKNEIPQIVEDEQSKPSSIKEDSETAIQDAMYKGSLMAQESNLEALETLNYRKKRTDTLNSSSGMDVIDIIRERSRKNNEKGRDPLDSCTSGLGVTYSQDAPGIALRPLTNTPKGKEAKFISQAPTPRVRKEAFDKENSDQPIDDHQRQITKRLYGTPKKSSVLMSSSKKVYIGDLISDSQQEEGDGDVSDPIALEAN
jgi:hypothetical protein